MGSVRDDRKAVKHEASEPRTKQKLIAKLKSCKTFLRQILNSDWLRYTLLAVILLNMAMLVSAYIVTQYFNTDLQQYLDLAFKFFDAFYALEIACKLLAYVFLAGQRWKYLTNKIFLMEVAIGAFHCLDLVFWESNTTLRVLRLFFVLRLLTLFKSLQKFTKYMIQSVPALGLILACFFMIYVGHSVIGIELFGASGMYRCRYYSEFI